MFDTIYTKDMFYIEISYSTLCSVLQMTNNSVEEQLIINTYYFLSNDEPVITNEIIWRVPKRKWVPMW